MTRIYLSPPHLAGNEMEYLQNVIASNWIAPLGPHVNAFEKEAAGYIGVGHAAAMSSGTAALHLALVLLGIGRGDEVLCSSLTFIASANAIVYQGATPVFIDSDRSSWTLDPGLLEEELERGAGRGRLPKGVMCVDLYGQSADYDRIGAACERFGVPLIEDAAEAMGATYKGKKAGSFGKAAAFSFNGNKIITTSAGGMLVSEDADFIQRARSLSNQARDPAPHYEHSVIGYNYRMSNVLAAIGRCQLGVLDERVETRRLNFEYYRKELGRLPGLSFMPEAPYGRSNRWLTCITIDPAQAGVGREDIRLALERANIESRPIWKPMHLQPVFADCRMIGGKVSNQIFDRGLCLPSGSSLTNDQMSRIVEIILREFQEA